MWDHKRMTQRSPAFLGCTRIVEAGENMRLGMAGKLVACVSVQGGPLVWIKVGQQFIVSAVLRIPSTSIACPEAREHKAPEVSMKNT